VVLAQDLTNPVRHLPVQVPGIGISRHLLKRPSAVMRHPQHMPVIAAQTLTPPPVPMGGKLIGGTGIAAIQNMPARLDAQLTQRAAAGTAKSAASMCGISRAHRGQAGRFGESPGLPTASIASAQAREAAARPGVSRSRRIAWVSQRICSPRRWIRPATA
jgi:hypothetical protein